MDAVEYIKKREEICGDCGDCFECPFNPSDSLVLCNLHETERTNAEKAVELVEKHWQEKER